MKNSALEGVLRRLAVPAAERRKAHEIDAGKSPAYDQERVHRAVTVLFRNEGQVFTDAARVSLLAAFRNAGLDLQPVMNADTVLQESLTYVGLALQNLMVPEAGRGRAMEVFTTEMTDAQRERAALAAEELLAADALSTDGRQVRTEMRRRLEEVFNEVGFDLRAGVDRVQAAAELAARTAATAEVPTKIIPTEATTRQVPAEPEPVATDPVEPALPVPERPTEIIPADATTREPPVVVPNAPEVDAFLRTVHLQPHPATRQFALYSPQPGTITFTVTYNDGTELTTDGEEVVAEELTYVTPHADAYELITRITATVVRDGATVAEGAWDREVPEAEPAVAQPDDILANPGQTIVGTGEEGPGSTEETREQVAFMSSDLHIRDNVVTVVAHPDVDGIARVTLTLDNGQKVEAELGIIVDLTPDALEPTPAAATEADTGFTALFDEIAGPEPVAEPAPLTRQGVDIIMAIPDGRTVARMDLNYFSNSALVRRSVWLPTRTEE